MTIFCNRLNFSYNSLLISQISKILILQVEIAHEYPHEIIVYHDVITSVEAEGMIQLSLPRIQRAVVGIKILSASYISINYFDEQAT